MPFLLRRENLLIASVAMLYGVPDVAAATDSEIFNFFQFESSLSYLEEPSGSNLEKVVESEGMQHLKNHSDRTGYYSRQTTAEEIAIDLLTGSVVTQSIIDEAKQLLDYVKQNKQKQSYCISETKKYLPKKFEFEGHLFMIWGYDIGVSMDKNASLNLVHNTFRRDPDEIWFYCIHEMHHAGIQHFNEFPDLSKIQTGIELFQLVRFSTFLEGSAVYASYEARRRNNALDDRDYIALEDHELMIKYQQEYFEIYKVIEEIGERTITDADWSLLDNLSDGKRLWYRVGSKMAEKIDIELGRAQLNLLMKSGPDAFFESYLELVR